MIRSPAQPQSSETTADAATSRPPPTATAPATSAVAVESTMTATVIRTERCRRRDAG